MKTPDFVDKVAAGLGRPKPLRPQGPFRLCAVHCGTISLTPVDSILSMKMADFVDKTVSNALLSMKTPDLWTKFLRW